MVQSEVSWLKLEEGVRSVETQELSQCDQMISSIFDH